MRYLMRMIVWVFYIGCFINVIPASAQAQAIVITTCDFAGTGSISEAIETLREAGGSIFYDMACETTFESRLTIRNNVSISANNPNVTFDGGATTALFFVDYGAVLSLDRINLRNGMSETAGGAIENYSMVLIRNGFIESHTAPNGGAIYNEGVIVITASFLLNNNATGAGGVLFNTGTASITNSNISGNMALNGGGVYNSGTFTITHTILSNNSAESAGGALYNTGLQASANNTFSNNRAVNFGGAIYNESRAISLAHNTFTRHESANGGSLFNGGTVIVTANIFDNGACASSGTIVDGGYNIINIADGCPGTIIDPELTTNDVGQIFIPANRAIEYAPPCALPIDSASISRPIGAMCTPGATEIDDN